MVLLQYVLHSKPYFGCWAQSLTSQPLRHPSPDSGGNYGETPGSVTSAARSTNTITGAGGWDEDNFATRVDLLGSDDVAGTAPGPTSMVLSEG